jgi:hypothetical protein
MPACSDDVRDINSRLARVEHDIAQIKTAFLLNDRQTEDYDGHRNDHRVRVKQAEAVEGYKQAATKKIILGAIAVFFTILSLGLGPYLRGLLGGG